MCIAVAASTLRATADLGTRLLGVLKPATARGAPSSRELKQVREARDRLWTLFARRWEDDVWRAGAWLFGREVAAHVPSLLSRAGRTRRSSKTAAANATGGATGT